MDFELSQVGPAFMMSPGTSDENAVLGLAFTLPLIVRRKANPHNKSQSQYFSLDTLSILQRNSTGFWKSKKKTNPQNKNQSSINLPKPIGI